MTRTPWRRIASYLLCLSLVFANSLPAQNKDGQQNELQSTVTAPPNTRNVGKTLGGAYFVDKDLLDRYEALKARLKRMREQIASGAADSDSALKTLADIQNESSALRQVLETRKVLVSAFKVYSQTSEHVFPLGEEKLVIITGDNVVVRGWEGPGLKCVLEKTIIAKQPPPDDAFEDIRIEHELAVAEDKVGITREQRDQQEQKFLQSENGRKLTDEQRAVRQKFVDEIHHGYDDYMAFQGRAANSLQLQGLTYQQGNRSLTMRITSPGGSGTVSSQWQRHAAMTVYVPPCTALAVRGCMGGLDIQNIECDLVLTTHDSRDRNYEGSFEVRNVKGDVNVYQAPVRVLSGVSGNVRISATNEFVNSGTLHTDGTRTFSPYNAHATRIENIGGDLEGEFLRTDLSLSAIEGALDVVNRYGATRLTLDAADTERTHRILSEGGQIEIEGPAAVVKTTPIYAYTQCGRLHTNLTRNILDDVDFSTGRPLKNWHGMVTPSQDRFDSWRFERPAAVLKNEQRPPGLDLISHGGAISILTTE